VIGLVSRSNHARTSCAAAARQGEVLKAGQLIFSGSVTAPVPVVAGGMVTFEFAGLGSIDVFGA
jgi:2-oxo-3-hexenedioate decarboxylase